MKAAIVGGKLQGTEAVYLAALAGIESILIDKNPEVPASGFCDEFVCGDIVAEDAQVIEALKRADFVLPANENSEVLEAIRKISEREGLKLAFDFDAYAVSSSKILSDKLFHENGVPAPVYYPQGEPPYIIKPSGESGSAGVRLVQTREEVEAFMAQCENPANWIAQEYLEGPSFSIEVIGNGRDYRTYAITQIHMDDVYDCCMVTAPCEIGEEKEREFAEIGEKIARLLNLKGIMDVEVIDDGRGLKVLEIDARIPSQTPIAVYYSSGNNLFAELADIALYGEFRHEKKGEKKYCAYEHYQIKDGRLMREGEHSMASAKALSVRKNFFESDVVISDFVSEKEPFKGIFVNWADHIKLLEKKRRTLKETLRKLTE